MTVCATELAGAQDELVGWGLRVVCEEFARAGRRPRVVRMGQSVGSPAPRVWLVSLPYAGNARFAQLFFERVAGQPIDRARRSGATTFILGGHGVVNPEPWLDVFDAVFLGEADDRAHEIAECDGDVEALSGVPGLDTGTRRGVWWQTAAGLSRRGVYEASQEGERGVGRTEYLEVARGCRGGCRFCELGWLYGYSERDRDESVRLMRQASRPKDVVLSAPDTDGVSWFHDVVASGEYDPRWRSTRARKYLAHGEVAASGRRGRIRFGVEGVTEDLRRVTGKPMTDGEMLAAMQRGVREGYRQGRLFFIGGLPTETRGDRRHMSEILRLVGLAGWRHWKSCDVKVTGLSPQPLTPWQRLGIGPAIDAIGDYRQARSLMQRSEPMWRSVMVDRHSTEADVIKHMRRGQLVPYLVARGNGRVTRPQVRAAAIGAGVDYDGEVCGGYAIGDVLPWSRVRHPNEARIAKFEIVSLA